MQRGEGCEKGEVADLKKDLAAAEGKLGGKTLPWAFLRAQALSLLRVQSPGWEMGGDSLMGKDEFHRQVLRSPGDVSFQQVERSVQSPIP